MRKEPVYISAALGFAALGCIYFVPAGGFVSLVCAFAAPALFLYAFRQCADRKQCLAVFAFFAAGLIVMYLHYSGSILLDIVCFLVSAAYISIAFFLDRRFCGTDGCFSSTLVFPAVWVSLFHISGLAHIGFQFRLDAYVTELRALTQIESLIGSAGVLFFVLWTASVAAYLAQRREKFPRAGIAVWALAAAFAVVFGAVRLQRDNADTAVIRAAYCTGPYIGDFVDYEELDYDSYAEAARQSAADAAKGGAELLVFSEEAFYYPLSREAEFSGLLSGLAREYGMSILSGEEVYLDAAGEEDLSMNRISLYDSEGRLVFQYLKHSLVPIIETSTIVRGEAELPSAELEFGGKPVKLSSCICYDSNFSPYISTLDNDVQLLLIPSWDWHSVTDYHGEVARELAIENGVTVLKVTYDGLTYLFSPTGETLHASSTDDDGYSVVHFADIPVQTHGTVYSTVGRTLSVVFTAATTAVLILLEIMKRKTERRNG